MSFSLEVSDWSIVVVNSLSFEVVGLVEGELSIESSSLSLSLSLPLSLCKFGCALYKCIFTG